MGFSRLAFGEIPSRLWNWSPYINDRVTESRLILDGSTFAETNRIMGIFILGGVLIVGAIAYTAYREMMEN
jgi:hypothetical protein